MEKDNVATLLDISEPVKHLKRTGWLLSGVEPTNTESVGAHSWRMALIGAFMCPPELDSARVMRICLAHDLAEGVVGDITPYCGVSDAEKEDLERAACTEIAARMGRAGQAIQAAWEEYEGQETPEAKFVKELDKLDMCRTALHYAEQGVGGMDRFFESSAPVFGPESHLGNTFRELQNKLN